MPACRPLSHVVPVALLILAAALLGGSCASERASINRVQANGLKKEFFVGTPVLDPQTGTQQLDANGVPMRSAPEFYMRTTVVDAATGAGNDGLFTSSDSQPTSRVRFEITEKMLLARLTYELVQDTDYKGARRTPDGQIVASFAIEKHFDVKRDYNPTTGEPLNVLVENDSDRPWFEREYFRVDWSKNLVTDAYDLDALSGLNIWYGVKFDPIGYYISDPNHPDHPVFDDQTHYFDITTKAFAAPQVIHDPEWGDFPACWLYGPFPMENCNPSEVTLRHSFLKVVDHDYEPADWDGTRMDVFGWFTADRFGYDRRYGVTDDKWHRFATRWNLYEQSHADPLVACNTPETTPVGASPHRDEDGNGTEDECEAVGRGSRCDEFRGECTLPLRDRKIRTIPWHVNAGFPEELFEGTKAALDGWSEAIRVALVAGRLSECRRTGEAECEAQLGWPVPWADNFSPPVGDATAADVPKVFVLCHNPVDPTKGDDEKLCGKAGSRARLGDLRYNFVNLVNEPQQTSPWGIMMDAEDPLTGEKISGSVNQWGAVLDRAASSLVDIVGLLDGEIDPTQFLKGKNVSEWVAANRPGGPAERGMPMSAAETASRRAAFDPQVLAPYLAGIGTPQTTGKKVPPAVRHRQRAQALQASGRLGPGNNDLTDRLRRLRQTALESKMVTPDQAQAAGFDPTTPPSADAIKQASPFGRMNPVFRRADARNQRLARAGRHSCRLEAAEPDNLLGMAREIARLFPAPDPSDAAAVNAHRQQVWLWARQQYSQGVFAHEMGHSMGLRHNFAATFDALSYRPQYWQLRTKDGSLTEDCAEGTVDGSNCVGPRWRDPLTSEEIDNSIGRYATSSVMDYPGDQNHDTLLQGKYDRAAMRMGYGGVVDVWDGPSVRGTGTSKSTAYKLTAFTSNPGLFGVYYFPPTNPQNDYLFIHYSQYQKEFGLIRDCQPSSDPNAVRGTKCAEAPLDVVDYRDMQDFASDPDYAAFSWGVNPRAVDPQGRVRRGYLFSSDEFADTGNVPSFTYDAGADAYEQIRFLESAYENRYILDGFRRNRVQFTSWDTVARIQSHYLDTIQMISKSWAFGAILDGDPTQPSAALLADGHYGPLAMGATVALDLYARILTRPDPGYFCPAGVCGGIQPFGVDDPVYVADSAPLPDVYLYDFSVPIGTGRYVYNDYDYSQGYWWSDYQTQVGSYYEKIWATYYLTEAFDFFVSNSREDFTDGRYKNVNFATVYPEQIRRLFSSIYTGDVPTYAPWTAVPANPQDTPPAQLTYPDWHSVTPPGARPAGTLLADPDYSWNEQLYAMVWGAMFFPTNWSQSWINDARITVLAADQAGWPAAETYTYYDPPSGMTYRAHAIGTEPVMDQVRQRGTGARMLEWANRLLAIAYIVQRDTNGNPVLDAGGAPILVPDAAGRAQKDPAHPGAGAALQKYVDTIDIMRQLTAEFGRALDGSDMPQP